MGKKNEFIEDINGDFHRKLSIESIRFKKDKDKESGSVFGYRKDQTITFCKDEPYAYCHGILKEFGFDL